MLDVKLRRLADNELVPVNLAALALSVRGEFRFPAEENSSAEATTGPAVVIHCMDRWDVVQCLEFASRWGLLVAMRNSRTDPVTWADCDQGIAVDLSALSSRGARRVASRGMARAGMTQSAPREAGL